MCGRTACTLEPSDICKATRFRNRNGKWSRPAWKNPPGQQKYYSSYNIAPGSHTPVLSKKHVSSNPSYDSEPEEGTLHETNEECDYIIQPMHWGLVPSWHKGEAKSVAFKMNNARNESILEKRSFKVPLEKGRRCVVLVDGYFEWHTSENGKKQPYFISFPQESTEKLSAEGATKEVDGNKNCSEICQDLPHKRLLTMAGLFDVCHQTDKEAPLYSYSIITVEAHSSLSFVHHRMPAILNGEDEVRAWLDYDSIPLAKALQLIGSKDCLTCYPVSTLVNNVHNKSEDCLKPIDLSKPVTSKSSLFMADWLSKGKSGKQETSLKISPKKGKSSPLKQQTMKAFFNKLKTEEKHSDEKDETTAPEPTEKKMRLH